MWFPGPPRSYLDFVKENMATAAVDTGHFFHTSPPQGPLFKGIPKGQESKSWVFFEGPRRFRGPQKTEKNIFSKRTSKSVDHKFKSFAIDWPQISI